MGHTKTTITVAKFYKEEGKTRPDVLDTESDPNLGGRDLSWAVTKMLAEKFGVEISDKKVKRRLFLAAEKALHELSNDDETHVEFEKDEEDLEYDLEIATFEELIEDSLTQFSNLIDRLLLRIPAAKI